MNRFVVNSILGKLNAESAQITKSFLADSITEEEFKKQALALQQKYYDALVEKEVIVPSEEARQQIISGKGIPLAIEAAIKCKKGEITWKELSDVCSKQVLPLARQEAGNVH